VRTQLSQRAPPVVGPKSPLEGDQSFGFFGPDLASSSATSFWKSSRPLSKSNSGSLNSSRRAQPALMESRRADGGHASGRSARPRGGADRDPSRRANGSASVRQPRPARIGPEGLRLGSRTYPADRSDPSPRANGSAGMARSIISRRKSSRSRSGARRSSAREASGLP